jgi:hypothetical protein
MILTRYRATIAARPITTTDAAVAERWSRQGYTVTAETTRV